MASEIRRWLTKQPQPAVVIGTTADGDERKAKIGVQRSKWKDAEAILAECVKLEALDADGNVLRVCDIAGADGTVATPAKPANTELVELAKIISNAHDAGAARHENAYAMAFGQLAELTKAAVDRARHLEQAWHKLLMSQQNNPGFVDDPNAKLVETLVMGAMQKSGAGGFPPEMMELIKRAMESEAKNGKPNGKSNGKGAKP